MIVTQDGINARLVLRFPRDACYLLCSRFQPTTPWCVLGTLWRPREGI